MQMSASSKKTKENRPQPYIKALEIILHSKSKKFDKIFKKRKKLEPSKSKEIISETEIKEKKMDRGKAGKNG